MTSAITQPLACISMVDAADGDAYVVDILVIIGSESHKDIQSWNRYIIDTGMPYKQVRDGLHRAVFNVDRSEVPVFNQTLRPPWSTVDNDKETPKICGITITHTDRDHWGNAEWLCDQIKSKLWEKMKPDKQVQDQLKDSLQWKRRVLDPLPIYTSPMIHWALYIQEFGRVATGKEPKGKSQKSQGKPVGMNIEDDKKTNADDDPGSKADDKAQEMENIDLNQPPKYCWLKYESYVVVKSGDTKTRYRVRWQHENLEPPLEPSVRWSFRSVQELADVLGYLIEYRFNLLKADAPLPYIPSEKLWEQGKMDKRETAYLHCALPDEWIKENTQFKNTEWAAQSSFNFEKSDVGQTKQVLGEARLVPPPKASKRSYRVLPSDPNEAIAGYWLRAVVEIHVEPIKQETQSSTQIITEDESFDFEPDKPYEPLRTFVDCLGLQDRVYPLRRSLKRGISLYSESRMGAAGTRFSRDFLHMAVQQYLSSTKNNDWAKLQVLKIERDNLRTKSDKYIQHQKKIEELEGQIKTKEDAIKAINLREIPKAQRKAKKEEREGLEKELKALKEKRKSTNQTFKDKTTEEAKDKKDDLKKLQDEWTKLANGSAPLNKERLEQIGKEIHDLRGPLSYDKEIDTLTRSVTTNHSDWSSAANRASLITHFRTPRTRGGPVEFEMLFTGDAFEVGAQAPNPYSDHQLITNEDWNKPWSTRPRTIESPGGVLPNPDGNILNWLWQYGSLKSMRVAVLKLPHHGSSRTTNSLFYRLVSASVYLISASVSRHGHPRPETLASIVETILREDGPALAPRKYRSVETEAEIDILLKNDKDEREKEKERQEAEIKKQAAEAAEKGYKPGKVRVTLEPEMEVLPIKGRPRPRLIFATFGTRKDQLLTQDDVVDTKKELALLIEKARDWQAAKDAVTETLASGDDAIDEEDDQQKQDADPTKKAKKGPAKGKVDIQDFVYFHSRHLGGFGDEVYDKFARQKMPTRLSSANEKRRQEKAKQLGKSVGDGLIPPVEPGRQKEKAPRANVRIFVQKREGAATRLIIGNDSNRPNDVRVEWLDDDWDELRADKPADNADDLDDPVAYPRPGQNPKWEVSSPKDSNAIPRLRRTVRSAVDVKRTWSSLPGNDKMSSQEMIEMFRQDGEQNPFPTRPSIQLFNRRKSQGFKSGNTSRHDDAFDDGSKIVAEDA